ncbi:MAG: nitroreductase family protein [Synergistaceae bacterium]|nr:nitroreductase family protein [Synergistaceae bacterium]
MLAASLLRAVPAGAESIALPPPPTGKEGGMSLFEALWKRSSQPGGDFPAGALDDKELGAILWAATGLNRGEKGWTVPMAMGLEPYVRLYVARDDGVFLYDWKEHALKEVSKENIRAKVGAQSFVRTVPCILILAADAEGLSGFREPDRTAFACVAAGAMTQDVYLAAAALGVGARYIHSMNRDAVAEALALEEGAFPLCLMLLGK